MTDTIDRDKLIAEATHAGRRIIERYELSLVPGDNLAEPYTNAGMPHAHLIWEGGDCIGGNGYDWMDDVAEHIGWRPNASIGQWPEVVEYIATYDPKHNPPEGDDTMERLFLKLLLRRIEGEVYLGFYLTTEDVATDVTPYD